MREAELIARARARDYYHDAAQPFTWFDLFLLLVLLAAVMGGAA